METLKKVIVIIALPIAYFIILSAFRTTEPPIEITNGIQGTYNFRLLGIQNPIPPSFL
jgi:hypothetical protein